METLARVGQLKQPQYCKLRSGRAHYGLVSADRRDKWHSQGGIPNTIHYSCVTRRRSESEMGSRLQYFSCEPRLCHGRAAALGTAGRVQPALPRPAHYCIEPLGGWCCTYWRHHWHILRSVHTVLSNGNTVEPLTRATHTSSCGSGDQTEEIDVARQAICQGTSHAHMALLVLLVETSEL